MPDRIITIDNLDVLDPGELRENAVRLRLPMDFWGRANSISNPLGSEPGSAWIVVPRATWNALDNNAAHSLTWTSEFDSLTTAGWTIVRALCLAQDGDLLAAYLIELKDRRHLLRMSSVNSQYNVRIPSPHKTESDASSSGDWSGYYYSDSLDGGTDKWTWQTLLDDLWSKLPAAIAGTAPTLPYTPVDMPENWRFIGCSAWNAIDEILDAINCRIAWHPTAGTFSYVRLGQTQSGLIAAHAALVDRLLYDYKPGQNLNRAECPETFRVFFQRRPEYAGSERDTTDADNWEMAPAHSEDVASGVTGAVAGTVMPVWDSLIADVAMDDTIINSADLAARAAEVASELVNRITIGDERARKHYAGISTSIMPGSEVSDVVWRDYGDGDGVTTEIRNISKDRTAAGNTRENRAKPDLARASHLVWPHVMQIVQAYDSGSAAGTTLTANADGLIPGRIVRWTGSAWTVIATVWLKVIIDPAGGTAENEAYYHARLAGDATSGGTTRPLYLIGRAIDTTATVQIYKAAAGTRILPSGSPSIYSARLYTTLSGVTGANVWLMRVGYESADQLAVFSPCRLIGSHTIAGDTRPLYEWNAGDNAYGGFSFGAYLTPAASPLPGGVTKLHPTAFAAGDATNGPVVSGTEIKISDGTILMASHNFLRATASIALRNATGGVLTNAGPLAELHIQAANAAGLGFMAAGTTIIGSGFSSLPLFAGTGATVQITATGVLPSNQNALVTINPLYLSFWAYSSGANMAWGPDPFEESGSSPHYGEVWLDHQRYRV